MCENKSIDSVLLNVVQTCLGVTLATIILKISDYITEIIRLRYEVIDEEDEQPVIWRSEKLNSIDEQSEETFNISFLNNALGNPVI